MIIKPYSILIVEDEYLIARDIKNILNKEGYSYVMMADSVDEAIEIIKECKPSLVLIDINYS
jgi:YesN/AraC family two-component response regulator